MMVPITTSSRPTSKDCVIRLTSTLYDQDGDFASRSWLVDTERQAGCLREALSRLEMTFIEDYPKADRFFSLAFDEDAHTEFGALTAAEVMETLTKNHWLTSATARADFLDGVRKFLDDATPGKRLEVEFRGFCYTLELVVT
jgi:hypothetical protein